MDFNSTVDIIIRDINDLKEIINDFKSYKDVPTLQVEIAKAKCRNAVEILELLKAESYNQTSSNQAITKKPALITEPTKEVKKPEPAPKLVPEQEHQPSPVVHKGIIDLPKEISPKIETVTKTLIETFDKEELFDIDDNEHPERLAPGEEVEMIHKEMRNKHESTIIAETFTSNPNSINNKISKQKHPENPQGRKSTNLLDIIGINDKFLLIREVFNGNIDSYNTAINRLNNANNFTEAQDIILDYVDDEEDEAHKMLTDFVKRKFY